MITLQCSYWAQWNKKWQSDFRTLRLYYNIHVSVANNHKQTKTENHKHCYQNRAAKRNTKRNTNLGPQWALVGLCLVWFHSVRLLFLNVSSWELNCYKWEGNYWIDKGLEKISELCNIDFVDFWHRYRRLVTTFKWEIYCRIMFTYIYYII